MATWLQPTAETSRARNTHISLYTNLSSELTNQLVIDGEKKAVFFIFQRELPLKR
jgi:hypothetical protein